MRIEIKGYIFAKKHSYRDEVEYQFFDWDLTNSESFHDRVKVCEHTLVAEIPDNFDLRPGLVANLERQREQVQAEFSKRVTEINAQIQSLLAIEA